MSRRSNWSRNGSRKARYSISNSPSRSLESLEQRCLLAGDLVANWQAQALDAALSNGDVVTEWTDSVSGIVATNSGDPKLATGVFSGRAAVRFDASDGVDRLRISDSDSPISGATDFSVTIAFATASNDLVTGAEGQWYGHTGLVDANRLGFGKDWGLSINASGQLATGVTAGFGGSKTTLNSAESGLNDGSLHFATVTRSGGNLALYVDGNVASTTNGASADARDAIELSIGALGQGTNGFTGDIAEVRIYNGAMTAAEVAGVHADLESYYVNLPPTAVDDVYNFNEDEGLFGFIQVTTADGLLSNDSDPEGDAMTAEFLTQPTSGTITPNDDGSFVYDPPADFFGVDTFTYQAFDGQHSNVATVTINVANVYDPAEAVGDRYKTRPTEVLNVSVENGLLANDANPDRADLTVELVSGVGNGTLDLNADGSFNYNADGFAGTTSFSYRIDDGTGKSNTANVTLVVNTPPVSTNDVFTVDEDATLTVGAATGVTANDIDAENDSLQVTLLDDVANGTLNLNNDGSFTYLPHENYVGGDSFTYKLSDGEDESGIATANITVNAVNDAPIANSDVFVTLTGKNISAGAADGLLRNDTDIENDSLTAAILTQPANGTVTVNADGSFDYVANDDFTGTDTFTYKSNDGQADSLSATVTLYVGTSPIFISEFLVANATGQETRVRTEPDGRFRGDALTPDWIELYNTTDADFDLGGYHLTDSSNNKTKWAFADGTVIGPGEYLIVYASRLSISDPALDETGRLHTNFKLQPEGEYLALTSPDGAVLHEYGPNYPNQRPDISYGLGEGNVPTYFASPSLGAANGGDTFAGIANDTTFSIDRGFFSEAFEVEITTTEVDGQIWFTLDGSEPSPDNGTLYEAPVQIATTSNLRAATFKDGLIPSLVDSQTYIFPADVLQFTGEGLESAPWGDNGPDWGMDPDIVNSEDPEVQATIDDLLSIPTVSISTDWDLFFGQQGIYPWDPGRGIGVARDGFEIPISFEYFDNTGRSTQSYSTIQIVGGSSPDRNVNDWKTDKLSMRVKFTENVGKSSLNYPVFGAEAVDSFSTLVVDARLNNVWTYSGGSEPTGQRGRALYFRDQLAADYENAAGGLAPHGHKTHTYINGVYWGIHTLHERPDDEFAASYLGGDNDDYDVIKHSPNDVIAGSNENYNALLDAVREDMEVQDNYEAVKEMLDVEEFISYMLVNQYGANLDWAHHNWYASFNRESPEGKWRFHSWDAEKIVTNLNDNTTTKNDRGGPTEIHSRLDDNLEYRLLYQDIVHREFFNGGTFTPETAAEMFGFRADQIDSAIRAESARWGDNQQSRPYTRLDWLDNVNGYLDDYFPNRTDVVLSQLERRGMWADEDHQPPQLLIDGNFQYGGFTESGSQLTLAASDGTIYYTTDGSDPRIAGGAVADSAVAYDGAIAINSTLNVKARLQKSDGSWSPISDATFTTNVGATPDSLRITEIHYHPADATATEIAAGFTDGDDFEFVELQNISGETIDLTDVRFLQAIEGNNIEGIQFDFAEGAVTELAPDEFVVVVEDVEAFQLRYGDGISVAGQWSGGLGNADEPIRLVAGDTTIHDFSYDDEWVAATDGSGPSLQIINANGELSTWGTAEAWKASTAIGGTPGAEDDGQLPGDSNGDGVFNSSDLIIVFQAAEYEDDIPGNSTFEEGDWNGDGDFNTSDLVFVFQIGHYIREAIAGGDAETAGAILGRDVRFGRPVAEKNEVVILGQNQAVGAAAELDAVQRDMIFGQLDGSIDGRDRADFADFEDDDFAFVV